MVVVGTAGGTGGLGRTITEAIEATRKHSVFVCLRRHAAIFHSCHELCNTNDTAHANQSTNIFDSLPNVTPLTADYTSVDDLDTVLREHAVDTISTLQIQNDESSKSQLRLIEAAEKSRTVKRSAPSKFGVDYMD